MPCEIGPGPGYLGLEWLKKTQGTHLTGVDISPGMILKGAYRVLRSRSRVVTGIVRSPASFRRTSHATSWAGGGGGLTFRVKVIH